MLFFHFRNKLFMSFTSDRITSILYFFFDTELAITVRYTAQAIRLLILSYESRLYHSPCFRLGVLHFGNACSLTAFQPIVVEPSSIRGLAADCPIHILFKSITFKYFIFPLWLYGSKGFPAIQRNSLYAFTYNGLITRHKPRF